MKDLPIEDRLYAVVTTSVRNPNKVMARIAPPKAGKYNFWTTDRIEDVWKMDRATAEDILAKLTLNNPRIMRYEKAVALLAAQNQPKASVAPEADTAPSPGF